MTRANCSSCKAVLDADASFCPQCGQPVATKPVCPGCGAGIDPDARFCPQCGGAVADATPGGPQPGAPGAAGQPAIGGREAAGTVSQRAMLGAVGAGLLLVVLVAGWAMLRGDAPSPGPTGLAEPGWPPPGAAPQSPPAAGAPVAPTAPAMPPSGSMPRPVGAGSETSGPGQVSGPMVFPHAGMGEGMAGGMGSPGAIPPGGPAAGPISGTIEVAPPLAGKVQPGAVLFLMARPVGDPPQPPIAVAKIPVGTFPIPFTLGQEDLMGGQWGAPVSIDVRLDQDGEARSKQPGDLQGHALGNPIKPGDTQVKVVLDQEL